MNLYDKVLKRPDILLSEYKKTLLKQRAFPEPIKKLIKKLAENETVTSKDFNNLLSDYLS